MAKEKTLSMTESNFKQSRLKSYVNIILITPAIWFTDVDVLKTI